MTGETQPAAPLTVEEKRERLKRLLREQRDTSLPLSFAQERLFVLDQLAPAHGAYNIPIVLRVRSSIDLRTLERSLTRLVERHEALRTSFSLTAHGPVQQVHPPSAMKVSAVTLEPGATDEAVAHQLYVEIQKKFDISMAPLLRATAYRHSTDDWILLFVMHHIVSDRRSMQILTEELLEIYQAESQGRVADLPPLPLRPADLARLERERLSGPHLESLRAYWSRELAGAPMLRLPADRPPQPVPSWAGRSRSVLIDAATLTTLKQLGADHHATLFMTLLAAFAAFLIDITGQQDFVIGAPITERRHAAASRLIGMFVNTLALRVRHTPGETFGHFLAQVRGRCLAAYDHQELPFDHVVKALQLPRNVVQATLTPVMFQLDLEPRRDLGVAGVDAEHIHWGAAKFDWDVCASERQDGTLRIDLEYAVDRFDDASIEAHLDALARSLRALSADSALRDTVPAGAWDEPTDVVRPAELYTPLHELFHAQAARTPNATALELGTTCATYGEVDDASSRLAASLRAMGVGDGSYIGVIAVPAIDTIVAMVGILKAGSAYVPLAPNFPLERLRFMVRNTSVRLVIGIPDAVGDLEVPVLSVGTLLAGRSVPPATVAGTEPRQERASQEQTTDSPAACVMYTSGSTGQPKGVAVTHAGIVRLFVDQTYARFGPDETFLQMAPLSFDASTFEIWGALLHGSRCVIETGRIPHAAELANLLEESRITTAWMTASLFNAIVDQDPGAFRPLRQLLIGGEVLSLSHVRRVLEALPDIRIINGYGPTETTVFACCYPIPRHIPGSWSSIPIGPEIAHTSAFVVDEGGHPVAAGERGELWIGGPGVALGYVNEPTLTAQQFVTDRRLGPAGRLFRTGDQVRRRPDGALEFLGRLDQQVKIRGFRVEPAEIEATISQHPLVSSVCVLAKQQPDESSRLFAYVSFAATATVPDDLRSFVANRLPAYMVPSAFVTKESLPLTPHGKIDREALRQALAAEPDESSAGAAWRSGGALQLGDALQVRLVRIWCRVLNVSHVEVDQDFFAAGGDSLAALRLLGQIQEEFGQRVELNAVYNAPTIKAQAELLRGGAPAVDRVWIVRAGDDGLPIFCAGGDRVWLHVASRLSRQRPVIGAAMDFGAAAASVDPISHLAEEFVSAIRGCQPAGPYTIVGWCLMGLVALEAAQKLQAQGESVDLLVMADTFPPLSSRALSKPARIATWIRMELASAWFHLSRQPSLSGTSRFSYLWDKAQGFLGRLRLGRDARRQVTHQDVMPKTHSASDEPTRVLGRIVAGSYRHAVRPYDGRVLFCTPMDRPPGKDWKFGPMWRQLVRGPFEDLLLPGDHRTMFETAEIQQLADRLSVSYTPSSNNREAALVPASTTKAGLNR